MSEEIEDGDVCPYCGDCPIMFYGDEQAECPNCGAEFVLAEDD